MANDGETPTTTLEDDRKLREENSEKVLKDSEKNTVKPLSGESPKQEKEQDGEKKVLKPSKFKEIWGKVGLDAGTVMMMFKGSIAPTIAVAFYQADSVSVPIPGL